MSSVARIPLATATCLHTGYRAIPLATATCLHTGYRAIPLATATCLHTGYRAIYRGLSFLSFFIKKMCLILKDKPKFKLLRPAFTGTITGCPLCVILSCCSSQSEATLCCNIMLLKSKSVASGFIQLNFFSILSGVSQTMFQHFTSNGVYFTCPDVTFLAGLVINVKLAYLSTVNLTFFF